MIKIKTNNVFVPLSILYSFSTLWHAVQSPFTKDINLWKQVTKIHLHFQKRLEYLGIVVFSTFVEDSFQPRVCCVFVWTDGK